MDKIPILLLAAGNSSRMGYPKQLLQWGNKMLIEHQIETLMQTLNPINIVLGAQSNTVIPIIKKYDVNIFVNRNWKNGMGNSIAFGVHRLLEKFPNVNGLLITLLDQPLLTASHINKMLSHFNPGNQQIIVSQSSSGWKGVPVLFDKTYFGKLKKLDGEEGAKTIIQNHKESIISIDCEEILEDIDTPEAYKNLLKRIKS